jgi:hypothetical protein
MQLLKLILTSLCLNFIHINDSIAQLQNKNLVKNPSFEDYHTCPKYIIEWRGTIKYCKNWYNTQISTPDYFNACYGVGEACCASPGIPYAAGYQYPRSGNAMSGIALYAYSSSWQNLTNYREYITGELWEALETDSIYCFEMYCNRNFRSFTYIYSHTVGVLFTHLLDYDTTSFNSSIINKVPQVSNTTFLIEDTLGWTKIAHEFIATDTFRYLTIGNFEPDATTWITIIDTSVWFNASYIYIDDVAVYKGKCREEEKPQKTFFNLYPNPGSGVFSLNYGVSQDAQLVVYDILGRTVLNETLAADKVLHHFIMQQYSNGMYFLKVFGANDDELYSQKFLLQR